MSDLRFALRQLRANAGFAAVALLTLALGIGATTAIFSVVRGVLLRPLPYGHPARVVMVWNRWIGYDRTWISPAELFDYRKAPGLASLAAFSPDAANLEGNEGARRVAIADVTPDLFDVLEVRPERGRGFRLAEGRPGGATDVAMISDALWRRRYGSDPSIVGRRILVNGKPRTVIGVLPRGFRLPIQFESARPAELYLPLVLDPAHLTRGSHYLYCVGRLAPSATEASVTAELRGIIARLQAATGDYPPQMHFEPFALPVREQVVGTVRAAIWVLLGAVVCVLLIACVNIANLLLARLEARRREFTVRLALGVSRAALARQLLVEGGVLAAGGAFLGVGLALLVLRLLTALGPGSLPRLNEVRMDPSVLAVTVLVTVACGVFFGLAPLLRLWRGGGLAGPLREGGRGAIGSGRRLRRRMLVAGQAMLALALLVSAGLLVRSFWGLLSVDFGMRPSGVLSFRISLPKAEFPGDADVASFYQRLLERLESLPGVRSAGAARALPLNGSIGDWNFDIEGHERPPGGRPFTADWQVATPGFFRAAGIPLVSGRTFSKADDARAAGVIVIDRALAERFFSEENPLGRRIRIHAGDTAPWMTVIGVVGDVRYASLTEAPRPTWYIPEAQSGMVMRSARRTLSVLVRTSGDPNTLVGPVRNAVRDLDARVPLARVASLDQVVSAARAEPRFLMAVLGAFALLATILAAIGLYGVMAYYVRQRDREVAVRMAMGARSGQVVRLVLRQGLLPVAVGLASGLLLAVAASRALRGLLYGVGTLDPLTYAAVILGFTLVAGLACALPARRAARIDPMEALRHE